MRNKKKDSVLYAVLAVLLFAMVFGRCEADNKNDSRTGGRDMQGLGTFEGLSADTERQIRQEWEKFTGTPLRFYNYYGTHDGYVVIDVLGDGNGVVFDVYKPSYKLAGTIFRCHHSTIWLWKNGRFQTMHEAYQQSLITPEIIAEIGSYHINVLRQSWLGDDESFYEWFYNSDDIQIFE